MERAFTKTVVHPQDKGITFAKKGEVRDYTMFQWRSIAEILMPKTNPLKALNSFSVPVEQVATMAGGKA